MASLPTIKQIYRADLGPDAPQWVESILSPLNQFMEEIYSAFNKNLTIPQNVASQIKILNFRTASSYLASDTFDTLTFQRDITTRGRILLVGKIEDTTDPTKKFDAVTASWDDINGTINIYFLSGLDDSKEYNVTFLLL